MCKLIAESGLTVVTVIALAAGLIAWLVGNETVADGCWIAGTVVALLPAAWWVISTLREGRVGVDVMQCCRCWERL